MLNSNFAKRQSNKSGANASRTLPKIFSLEKLLFIIISFCGAVVFVQNFVMSSSFDLLWIRGGLGGDDIGFQTTLRDIHAGLARLGEKGLFETVDFGYGWIYWFPLVVITYPAYLLHVSSGVDWPLIVIPRMTNLFFSLGATFVMYKIARIYTKNKWIIFTVVLLLPLFPTGAHISGTFGTVGQVTFFSMLSVYLVVKNESLDRRKLRIALMAFAAAFATKLTAVILVPMLAALILNRFEFKFTKENFRLWIQEILLAVFVFVFLLCPVFVIFPFKWAESTNALNIIMMYVKNTASDGAGSFIINLDMILSLNYSIVIYFSLLSGLIICAATKQFNNIKRLDFAIFAAGYLTALLYLCFFIKEAWMVHNYMFQISFVIPLGLIALEPLTASIEIGMPKIKKVASFSVCALCLTAILVQAGHVKLLIDGKTWISPLHYFTKDREAQISVMLELQEKARLYLPDFEGGNILYDGSLPHIFSYLSSDKPNCWSAYDNLHTWGWVDADLIILDKSAKRFLPEDEFQSLIADASPDESEIWMEDRLTLSNLLESREVFEKIWVVAEDSEKLLIFKAFVPTAGQQQVEENE